MTVPERLFGRRVYLGDAVYATVDARGIVLTTEDGRGPAHATNTIVIEPDVLASFEHFVAALRAEIERGGGR